MTAFSVRPATSRDAPAIRDLLIAAFAGEVEAGLVADLESDGDIALALVAEAAGRVIGYVAYSPLSVAGGFALAPLAVLPERQGQGIGAALVEAAHNVLRECGADFVLVLGDPAYYARFGFSVLAATVFETPYDGPYMQALALSDFGKTASGKVSYAHAFKRLGEGH